MDIFSAFATDEKLEVEGKWFPLSKTARVLVARAGNPNYVAALRKALEKNQLDLENSGPEADHLAEQVMIDVISSTILLGWEGLSFKGKATDHSVAAAKQFLQVKDFRKKITGFSESFAAFKVKADEEQGNA